MNDDEVVDRARSVLAAFGAAIGLDALAIDEGGHCCIAFDRILVNFQPDPERAELVLYARLGALPAEPDRELLLQLLDANFVHRATRGATIGIDREERLIALAQRLPVGGLDPERLKGVVTEFVDTAEALAAALAAHFERREGAPGPDFGGPMRFV